MKRILAISLIFSLLFSLGSAKSLVIAQGEAKDINYSIKLTVTYVNPSGGTRIWNFTEEDRTISLFMNNAWQSVELKSITYPLDDLKNDTDGNNVAVLEFPKQQLLPGENMSYTVEYGVVSKPRIIANISEKESGTLDAIPQNLKGNYTRAEGPWLANDHALLELAHEIAGNEINVLKVIKSLVEWIKKNITYTDTHEVPLYPNETLSEGEGDCDDQAILLITLSRIMGIPSYLQIGTIYLPSRTLLEETYWGNHVRSVQRRIGWHGWAMVYVPPWGWLPVDLTFVTGDFADDPLNAVRHGAVVDQNTVQYMNVSKFDYVAASRQTRTFLLGNGFFIDMEDEMAEVAQTGVIRRLDPWVAVALVVVMITVLTSSFLIARRWRKRLEEPKVTSPSPLSLEA